MLCTMSCRGAAQIKPQPAVTEAPCPECTAPLTHSLSIGFIQLREVLYPNLAKEAREKQVKLQLRTSKTEL